MVRHRLPFFYANTVQGKTDDQCSARAAQRSPISIAAQRTFPPLTCTREVHRILLFRMFSVVLSSASEPTSIDWLTMPFPSGTDRRSTVRSVPGTLRRRNPDRTLRSVNHGRNRRESARKRAKAVGHSGPRLLVALRLAGADPLRDVTGVEPGSNCGRFGLCTPCWPLGVGRGRVLCGWLDVVPARRHSDLLLPNKTRQAGSDLRRSKIPLFRS